MGMKSVLVGPNISSHDIRLITFEMGSGLRGIVVARAGGGADGRQGTQAPSFNEPASLGIPELVFQAKVTKFGTKVGQNMLINISSGFFHNCQNFFFTFSNFAHGKSPSALSSL